MSRSSVSLIRAVAGGATGSAALLAANQAAYAAGVTDLDLGEVLGWSFVRGDQALSTPGRRKLAGFAWYAASGSALVPLLYWLGFRAMGGASAARGLGLGIVHYLAAALLLAVTEPPVPRKADGDGRPMGEFLRHYGGLERTANLAGHLAYGALIGAVTGRS